MADSRWLVGRARFQSPDAPYLYCFPHAGGSPGEFIRLFAPLNVNVMGIQLPGRGPRYREASYTDLKTLVASLIGSIEFKSPFVFFGHSFGAIVAYETACALIASEGPQPRGLLSSAAPAPQLTRPRRPVHHLPEEEFISAIYDEFGLTLPDFGADSDLREVALRALRADLQVLETRAAQASCRLTCPIAVVGGADDSSVSSDLTEWASVTSRRFSMKLFPGDHFYFRTDGQSVTRFVTKELNDWL